jgi:hypothetical protein
VIALQPFPSFVTSDTEGDAAVKGRKSVLCVFEGKGRRVVTYYFGPSFSSSAITQEVMIGIHLAYSVSLLGVSFEYLKGRGREGNVVRGGETYINVSSKGNFLCTQ